MRSIKGGRETRARSRKSACEGDTILSGRIISSTIAYNNPRVYTLFRLEFRINLAECRRDDDVFTGEERGSAKFERNYPRKRTPRRVGVGGEEKGGRGTHF